LLCANVLRDELKRLRFYRKPVWAQTAWEQCTEPALQSGIATLQLLARRLQVTDMAAWRTAAIHSIPVSLNASTTPSGHQTSGL
jgi:hypothetical protein